MLRELGFNVHVQHAHGLLLNYFKTLDLLPYKELCQRAVNYLNDIFITDAFVLCQPNVIACACLYLACEDKLPKLKEACKSWWEIFDASIDGILRLHLV